MSEKPFVILGQEIKKGSHVILDMDVARLHTGSNINIPVIVSRAKEDGPVLLLMAGVHGDEINGVAIVRDIIRKNYHKPTAGTIICIPVFNIFGYLNQTREFPDGRDLNRVFPGSLRGSLASQFAHHFTQDIAPVVDYVIDFHTGGDERENFPNVRYAAGHKEAFELAIVFDAPYVLQSEYIKQSVREALNKMGKTTLLFEGGKSKDLDQKVIGAGVQGALNVMIHLGMQSGDMVNEKTTVVVTKSRWLRASQSGMFQVRIKNGVKVKKGTLLGEISDPFGTFRKALKAPEDGYVFGVNTAAIVHKGDALFHIGTKTA